MKLVINPSIGEIYDWQAAWVAWLADRDALRGQTAHWDWVGKSLRIGPSANVLLVALADDDGSRCHGLMMIVWPHASHLSPGEQSVYVDYLETAPWNRIGYSWEPEHRGVGKTLLYHAVVASDELRYRGRISLCSLQQAEAFYRSLGMVELGKGIGRERELTVFELMPVTPEAFIKEIRTEGVPL